LEFSQVSGTNYYLAVVSVYSRDQVYVNHHSIPYPNWREGIKRLFRPAEIVWNRQMIEVQKRSLKKSNNLRLPSSVVNKLSKVDREKKKAEWLKAYKIVSATNGQLPKDCFSYPVHSKVVSQYGSPRRLPSGKKYYHTGLDLRAWYGTPIRAAGGGKLVLKEHMSSPGNNVIIDHGGGLYTRYMHFSKYGDIELGQRLPAGTVIGYSGSTGRSQAPHLHWEIIWKGNHASPERFLQSWEQICDLK
jgi:murein DD-endopeptidase MepM/ murein hydrolase activator NlpD